MGWRARRHLSASAVGAGRSDAGVVATTNGGVTWTDQVIPAQLITLYGVACATVSDCTAVGDGYYGAVVISTGDGGTTWTSHALPSGIDVLNGVSCSSVLDCFAVGSTPDGTGNAGGGAGVIVATTNGGATWNEQALPAGITSLHGVSCSSLIACTAVGEGHVADGTSVVVATTNGGATWNEQTIPTSLGVLYGVSCSLRLRLHDGWEAKPRTVPSSPPPTVG